MALSPQSIVVVTGDQMASDISGETVILGLTAGRYYGLKDVGARVWQLIQTPTAVSVLEQTIVSEYDVDRERCSTDLVKLLGQLIEAGLVEVRSEPGR